MKSMLGKWFNIFLAFAIILGRGCMIPDSDDGIIDNGRLTQYEEKQSDDGISPLCDDDYDEYLG